MEYDEAVETEPPAPKLPSLLCADSSLLPPLGVSPAPGICNGGPRLRPAALSCGTCLVPIGVARLNFGGCCRPGIERGGSVGGISVMGGAAALFTGL